MSTFDEKWIRVEVGWMTSDHVYSIIGKPDYIPDKGLWIVSRYLGGDTQEFQFWNREGRAYMCVFERGFRLVRKTVDGKVDEREVPREQLLREQEQREKEQREKEAHIRDVQVKRQAERRCVNCGTRLGIINRIRHRTQHTGCSSFSGSLLSPAPVRAQAPPPPTPAPVRAQAPPPQTPAPPRAAQPPPPPKSKP